MTRVTLDLDGPYLPGPGVVVGVTWTTPALGQEAMVTGRVVETSYQSSIGADIHPRHTAVCPCGHVASPENMQDHRQHSTDPICKYGLVAT